jgi:hypothetical protein
MIQRSARRQARRLCLATALAGASLALASAAQAQDTAPPSPITISGSAAVVTDYRLRGVSQSNNGFALQAGVTIAHESGFYVGTWGPTWPAGARSAAPTWNSMRSAASRRLSARPRSMSASPGTCIRAARPRPTSPNPS